MPITPCPDIDALLGRLLDAMQRILDKKLAGLYLYGSLVMGDFDGEVSDMDLLAVLSSELDPEEFEQLQRMHHDFVAAHPQWNDRIEIAYLSVEALQTFRTQRSAIAIISPGEPFHIKDAGDDWLMNWWMVRQKGVTLFGPSPTVFIPPIAREEFLQAVREHAHYWPQWVQDAQTLPGQAYAILTLCRALYTCEYGEQTSKKQAAAWVQGRFPQWAGLIQEALAWRSGWRNATGDPQATFPETLRFVHFAVEQIA